MFRLRLQNTFVAARSARSASFVVDQCFNSCVAAAFKFDTCVALFDDFIAILSPRLSFPRSPSARVVVAFCRPVRRRAAGDATAPFAVQVCPPLIPSPPRVAHACRPLAHAMIDDEGVAPP
jgi:hypothetical protein